MKWNKAKVSTWLFNTGMKHIEDGLFAEGGELIYESKFGSASESAAEFIDKIRDICEWDYEDIHETMQKILSD